jgi:hypothetical protein
LLTSPFHLDEVRPLADPPRLTVTAVPIEVSPGLAAEVDPGRRLVLVEREASMAAHIAADAARLLGGRAPEVRLAADAEGELRRLLGAPAGVDRGPRVLLSPRLWGEVGPAWRADPRLRQVAFRVCEPAWPQVAEAVGLPLTL